MEEGKGRLPPKRSGPGNTTQSKVQSKITTTKASEPIKIFKESRLNSSDDEAQDINESLQKTLSMPAKVVIPERANYVTSFSSDDENINNYNNDTDSLCTLERRKKVEKILGKSGQKPSETDHLHAALAKEASKQVKSSNRR